MPLRFIRCPPVAVTTAETERRCCSKQISFKKTICWNGANQQAAFSNLRLCGTRQANHIRFIGSLVKPHRKKYFCFTETKISLYQPPSRPDKRGIAQGHQCGAGCGGRGWPSLTRAPEADGEIVWSRHPNGWCQVRVKARGRRWQKRRAHRGEHV